MNDRFDLQIITQHHSEVYCGYFRRLNFGNSLTFSHKPLCFHAKPPNFSVSVCVLISTPELVLLLYVSVSTSTPRDTLSVFTPTSHVLQ